MMVREWLEMSTIVVLIFLSLFVALRVDEIACEAGERDTRSIWILSVASLFLMWVAGLLAYHVYWRV